MSEEVALPTPDKSKVVAIGDAGIRLTSLEELVRFASMIVQAKLAASGDTVASVCAKIQLGLELRLPPMTALKNIYVVNGRASIFGDAGRALLLASGKLEEAPLVEYFGTPDTDSWGCRVNMRRKGMPGDFVGEFTIGQAKRAGLWGKANSPWVSYPSEQLMWRAWWRAARAGFADVFAGVSSGEEMTDVQPPRDIEHEVLSAVDKVFAPAPVVEPPKETVADRAKRKLGVKKAIVPELHGDGPPPEWGEDPADPPPMPAA